MREFFQTMLYFFAVTQQLNGIKLYSELYFSNDQISGHGYPLKMMRCHSRKISCRVSEEKQGAGTINNLMDVTFPQRCHVLITGMGKL